MSKHTPGPWLIVDRTVYALTDDGKRNRFYAAVQDPFTSFDELEANARLISAAPELLEALEGVMRMIKWAKENDDSPKSALSHFISSEPVFAVAIAKATGETK